MEDEEKQAMKEQKEQDKEIQQIEQSYDAGEDNFFSVSNIHFLLTRPPAPAQICHVRSAGCR